MGILKSTILGILITSLATFLLANIVGSLNASPLATGFNSSNDLPDLKSNFDMGGRLADTAKNLKNITKDPALAEIPTNGGFFSKGSLSGVLTVLDSVGDVNSILSNAVSFYILDCPSCSIAVQYFIYGIEIVISLVILSAIFRFEL